MSDLKHMSVDALRAEVSSLSRYRNRLESEWTAAEQQVETIQRDIAAKRQKYHNLGQRESWARIYLAQKS
jgi:predicted RNase H-like nuclease (RuvC/YqgF family)